MRDSKPRRDYGSGRDYDERRYDIDDEYEDDENYDRRRGRRDGHYPEYLSDKELMKWSKKLLNRIDEKYKNMFEYDSIERKAKELGIRFDDEMTYDEFYTTTLMVFNDYQKALGTSNPDLFLRIAKFWLCDDDADLTGGAKLAAYYYHIVKGK